MYLHVPYIVHPVESLVQIAQKHDWVIARGKYESTAWAIDLHFHREFWSYEVLQQKIIPYFPYEAMSAPEKSLQNSQERD